MTDLFNDYYNNPRKQTIFTNMICANAPSENEKSFRFDDGCAQIINSKDVLGEVDLKNIKSELTDWNLLNKTIKGNDIIYISGDSIGASYKQYGFGFIDKNISNICKFNFIIDYLDKNNIPLHKNITIFDKDNMYNTIDDIIDKINDIFENDNIPLNASIDGSDDKCNVVITSLKLGYDFFITHMTYDTIVLNDDDMWTDDYKISINVLEKNNNYYIPNYKYRNGAFKGIIVKAEYPKYNNDIKDYEKSLMITHVIDQVPVFYKDKCTDLYHKYYVDVFCNLLLQDESFKIDDINDIDVSDQWVNDDYSYIDYNGMKLLRRDTMGLYGFCKYASNNNLWKKFGELYSIISSNDYENQVAKNLNNGIIIYNPNSFDVKLNILTWN